MIGKKVILLVCSLFIAVVIAEIAVRAISPQTTYSYSVRNSIDCYAPDANVAFSLAKSHRCKMENMAGEFHTTATLNSLGYRGKEFTHEKKSETTRILTLGDSMTFGWGVGDEHTWPNLLEKNLTQKGKNVEVINAGYKGGLSLDGYYVYLKNEGIKLAPDLVIVGYMVFNDISDLAGNNWEKVDSEGLPEKVSSCCHVVDGKVLRNRQISFKFRYPILRESHLFQLIFNTLQKKYEFFKDSELLTTPGEKQLGCELSPDCIHLFYPQEQKAYQLLAAMQKITESKGGKFLVVLLPIDLQFYPQSWDKYQRYGMKWYPKKGEEDFINQRVKGELSKRGINVLDLYPVFSQRKDEAYPFFPLDAHFNEMGTAWVADAISNFLHEGKML